MSRIKIGQIGVCHAHAAGKMNTLKKLSDVFEIVGVVDDRDRPATRFAGDDLTPYAGGKWLTEEELFSFPGLQAVTVETANLNLVPTAMRCLERRLAIHMDKPGGEDLERFRRLVKGCEERNLPFQMGYMFRNNPAMQWCLKAARNGWLGDIFEVQGSMSHNYGGADYHEYIGKFRGGLMFILGCHLVDFAVALLGPPTRVRPFLKSGPGFPDTIKNNCLAILEYPHAIVQIRTCSLEVDGLNRRRLKICGTRGSVELCPLERFDGQPLAMRLALQEDNGEFRAGIHTIDFGVRRDRYEDQLLELARMIRGEADNPYSARHECLVQEVLLAASGYIEWSNRGQ